MKKKRKAAKMKAMARAVKWGNKRVGTHRKAVRLGISLAQYEVFL